MSTEYIHKRVDYYSMRQLRDVIDELRNEYRIIGYRAYAQEQYAQVSVASATSLSLFYESLRVCIPFFTDVNF